MKYVVLLLWLVLSLQFRVSFPYQKFDYFKLSVLWVPSFCTIVNCQIGIISEDFILHGLWPQNYATSPRPNLPSFCYDIPYVEIEDQDLYVQMNLYWPNLKDGRLFNNRIWKYAWEKHGTCSILWYYEFEYFNLALQLFDRFNLLAHLAEKGVVPTNDHTYSAERIRLGIIELTTKEPDLFCNTNNKGQKQLLEIRICYTPGGEIEDCEPATLAHTCSNQQVLFPRKPDTPGTIK